MNKVRKCTTVLLIVISIITIFFSFTNQIVIAEENNDLQISIVEYQDGNLEFKCSNIANWKKNSLMSLFEHIIELVNINYNNYADGMSNYLLTLEEDKYILSDYFSISFDNFNIYSNNEKISAFASSKDCSIINTILRRSDRDKNGYKAYECSSVATWSPSPINRFKDIYSIGIESDSTPLFENVYGRMWCTFNAQGQNAYYTSNDTNNKKVVEHSVPGAVGCKMDLPGDAVLGGIIYRKMEMAIEAIVLVKNDFNMYSAYAHRYLIGAPIISFGSASFTVNYGTDLITGPVKHQVIGD